MSDFFGGKSTEYYLKYDPVSSSWKMWRDSAVLRAAVCLAVFFTTWMKRGMMRDGKITMPPMSAHRTAANASLLWLTPVNSDDSDRQPSKSVHLTRNGIFRHIAPDGRHSQMRLSQQVKLYASPRASDWKRKYFSKKDRERDSQVLPIQIGELELYASPKSSDWKRTGFSAGARQRKSPDLPVQIGLMEWKKSLPKHIRLRTNYIRKRLLWIKAQRINADWVDILMGFPMGWSNLAVPNDALLPHPDFPAPPGFGQHAYEPPRLLPKQADPHINHRLRADGNALVSQIVTLLGQEILDMAGETQPCQRVRPCAKCAPRRAAKSVLAFGRRPGPGQAAHRYTKATELPKLMEVQHVPG
jgi:hypothetical protein